MGATSRPTNQFFQKSPSRPCGDHGPALHKALAAKPGRGPWSWNFIGTVAKSMIDLGSSLIKLGRWCVCCWHTCTYMYTHVPAVLNGIRCGDQIIGHDRCGDHHCAHARKLRTTAHVIARTHACTHKHATHYVTHIYACVCACVLLAVHKLEPCGQLIVVKHYGRVFSKPVVAACMLEQP